MTKDQEERLVAAWEGMARGIGELNGTLQAAIKRQWPDRREPSDAIITRLPTPEEKIKEQTGNSTGPIAEWLQEFAEEEEIGPRERAFLDQQNRQSKLITRTKKTSQTN